MRKLILAATVMFTVLLYPAALAGAQEIPNDAPAVAPVAGLKLTEFTVLVITSLLIPLATGLITKLNASATVKQIVTLALSTVVGIVTTSTQADGTAIISLTTVQYALLSFAIAVVSYLGLYKPHDANARLAPNAGLG